MFGDAISARTCCFVPSRRYSLTHTIPYTIFNLIYKQLLVVFVYRRFGDSAARQAIALRASHNSSDSAAWNRIDVWKSSRSLRIDLTADREHWTVDTGSVSTQTTLRYPIIYVLISGTRRAYECIRNGIVPWRLHFIVPSAVLWLSFRFYCRITITFIVGDAVTARSITILTQTTSFVRFSIRFDVFAHDEMLLVSTFRRWRRPSKHISDFRARVSSVCK